MEMKLIVCSIAAAALAVAAPPQVGQTAPEFTLMSLKGKSVTLPSMASDGPVVLVMLRGFPGYQCPLCSRQVQDFTKNADGFQRAGARVVLVYPGPARNLDMKAQEFVADKPLPANFEMLLDPDYKLTNLYGLRWDAPNETAYPASFILDKQGKVVFSKVSKGHGGRTSASEMLEAMAKHAKMQ